MLDFGPNDYALFKGKIVEFRMAKRTVTIGRSTASSTVDFDLSLEGPAFKISRRQVRQCPCCNVVLPNTLSDNSPGKHPVDR